MRCWLLVLLIACASTPAPTIAGRATPHVEIAVRAEQLIDRPTLARRLAELPALPPRRGLDRIEERDCRVHFEYVRRMFAGEIELHGNQYEPTIARLVAAARVGGDCRIDVDELLARRAPMHVGGCTGATPDEAIRAWRRQVLVGSTPQRRATALRNVAEVTWLAAQWGEPKSGIDAWIAAGDAFAAAAAAAPDDLALSNAAVDGYENALRYPTVTRLAIARSQVHRIDARLATIADGDAADRARALRAQLSRRN